MEQENRFLEEYREEADFINERYGLGDLDHETALGIGHIYDLMRNFAKYKECKKSFPIATNVCR